MIHAARTVPMYMSMVTEMVRLYGRDNLKSWEHKDYQRWRFHLGFQIPNGDIYSLDIRALKDHYATKEWHYSTLRLPSGLEVPRATRIPPNIVQLFAKDLKAAYDTAEATRIEA